MSYRILITPTALADLREAVDYYNSRADGLGKRLVDDFDKNLQRVTQNPEAFAMRYKEVRAKLLNTFPYLSMHRVNQTSMSIEILRLFHARQKPYWK